MNDPIIYPVEYDRLSRILGKFTPNTAYGKKSEALLRFEYIDEGDICEDSIDVQVVRFDKYVKPRKDPTFPKFRG